MSSLNVIVCTDTDLVPTTSEGLVLVDFWAPWCGPCRMLAPVIDAVADELAGLAKVVKVNTDEAHEGTAHFGVQSIPTLIIFKNGKEVERLIGAATRRDALLTKLRAMLVEG